ncbi:MAG: Dyp-type peroxidase, partial [Myxococcota bacterium]
WAYVRAEDPGAALDRARQLRAALGDAVVLTEDLAGFTYRGGRDLSGYVDGTENPAGDAAVACAIVTGAGEGLDGGSFAATQRWVHDLDALARMAARARDEAIGRAIETDEELADAPASAHVKRSAQESFDPPAHVLRRSMPYGDVAEHGLYFVAFGERLDRFERILRRMAGLDDGVADALLRFSRPVSGAYYWCPPVRDGRLDLRALG